MNKYGLYNRVLETMGGDEGTFIASVRNLVEAVDEVSFNNEEADELFGKAKNCCMLWRKGAINGRISKRRMVEYVRKIAEMGLPNPFDPNEPEPVVEEPVVEAPAVEKEVVKETAEKEAKEKKVILGVVDEIPFAEEPKEEKHFFGKRKKG